MPQSVSMLAFDGHAFEVACEAVAAAGGSHVEPAFIESYGPVDESSLGESGARRLSDEAVRAGLAIESISLHTDPAAPDAYEKLDRRLAFAAAAGASYLLTNIARAADRETFLRLLDRLQPRATAHKVMICFENPGDGPSLISDVDEVDEWQRRFSGTPFGINLDLGNLYTVDAQTLRPVERLSRALQAASHIHLKDFSDGVDGLRHAVAIGDGMLGYDGVLRLVAARPSLPIGIEMPLRVIRSIAGTATTRVPPRELSEIQAIVARSLAFVEARFGVGKARSGRG